MAVELQNGIETELYLSLHDPNVTGFPLKLQESMVAVYNRYEKRADIPLKMSDDKQW